MGVARIPHLVRRKSHYYFRMSLPSDIVARSGKHEFKISLRTSNLSLAKRRCQHFSYASMQLIALIRRMANLSSDEINKLSREYFIELLKKGNEHEYFFNRPDSLEDPLIEADSVDGLIENLKSVLSTGGHVKRAEHDVQEFTSGLGLLTPPAHSEELATLCRQFVRAEIESLRITQAKLRGQYDLTTPVDPLFAGLTTNELPPIEGECDPSIDDIENVVTKFIEIKSASEWVEKTRLDYVRVLRWFADSVKPKHKINSIQKEDIKSFRNSLSLVPSGFEKLSKFSGKGFTFAAKHGDGLEGFSPKTINKYFDMLKTFFAWTCEEDILSTNPAANVKSAVSNKSSVSKRRPFSLNELDTFFRSPQYAGHRSPTIRNKPGEYVVRDWKFWSPLIALFTGMRLGEICQTYVNDLIQENGIIYLDLSLKHGQEKTLKSQAASRKIPIHKELISLDILGLFEKSQTKGSGARLFPEIKKGSADSFSQYPSRHFGSYKKSIGLPDPNIVFHSFRHNFRDALREADVGLELSRALMGHSDESVHASYGTGPSLKALNQAISAISYQLDLSFLHTK